MMPIIPLKDLTDEEAEALRECHTELTRRYERNRKRSDIYNTRRLLEKVGFSIPPSMATLEAVVGWPAKAVDQLSARLNLEGFVDATRAKKTPPKPPVLPSPGTGALPVRTPPPEPMESTIGDDLDDIFIQNAMALEWPQIQTSTFVHGCSFVAVTPGDPELGEPEVLIQGMPATEATGVWNVRTKRLKSALWVPEPKMNEPFPRRAVLFLPDHILEMSRDQTGPVQLKRTPNVLKDVYRVPVTRVAYRPTLGRPFGQTRLTRALIYYAQMAARTLLRTEVSAEFFSSPQRWMMGAPPDAFNDSQGNPVTAWETILGKVWTMDKDDEGDLPVVGQFPTADFTPHMEMMKEITTLFAGESSLPVSSLGIVHDNPASAEAIDAEWANMVGVAELCQTELGVAATEIAQNALLTADRSRTLKDLSKLRPKWRDASTPTRAAMADATVKLVGAGILPKESEVTLEQAGFDQTDIARILRDQEKARLNDPLANAIGSMSKPELQAGLQQQGIALPKEPSGAPSGNPQAPSSNRPPAQRN
jgi:hypothetical protein